MRGYQLVEVVLSVLTNYCCLSCPSRLVLLRPSQLLFTRVGRDHNHPWLTFGGCCAKDVNPIVLVITPKQGCYPEPWSRGLFAHAGCDQRLAVVNSWWMCCGHYPVIVLKGHAQAGLFF
jgi:hypothetical protein